MASNSDPIPVVTPIELKVGSLVVPAYQLPGDEGAMVLSAQQMASAIESKAKFVANFLHKQGFVGIPVRDGDGKEMVVYPFDGAMAYWKWKKSMSNDRARLLVERFGDLGTRGQGEGETRGQGDTEMSVALSSSPGDLPTGEDTRSDGSATLNRADIEAESGSRVDRGVEAPTTQGSVNLNPAVSSMSEPTPSLSASPESDIPTEQGLNQGKTSARQATLPVPLSPRPLVSSSPESENAAVESPRPSPETDAIAWLAPSTLTPHPRHQQIYGDEDIGELVDRIRASNWLRPLVVTPKGTIVSGCKRWRAASILGIDRVPVEVRQFENAAAELEALLEDNAARPKTCEQKIREANSWKEIETRKAKRRQQAGSRLEEADLMKIFSQGSRGSVRDIVAAKVQLGSGLTYSKGAKVVAQIDNALSRADEAIAGAWRKLLNEQSIESAHRLLKLPPALRDDILHLIATGVAENPKEARRLLAEERGDGMFQEGDIAIVRIDPALTLGATETRWNGCWGRVRSVERGGVSIDLGGEVLFLGVADLEAISEISADFQEVVDRVLALRQFPLDELEAAMLDVFQRRGEWSDRQLAYLEQMEGFWLPRS